MLATVATSAQQLQEGDLLFSCTQEPNAITDVTSGVAHLPIDHVAVVHRIGGTQGPLFVIEAVKPAVCLTPIDTFMCNNPQVIVGRVNQAFDVHNSIRGCLRMVGKPYDDLYLPGDSAVYCSELVQMSYVFEDGSRVFPRQQRADNRLLDRLLQQSRHGSSRRRTWHQSRRIVTPSRSDHHRQLPSRVTRGKETGHQ